MSETEYILLWNFKCLKGILLRDVAYSQLVFDSRRLIMAFTKHTMFEAEPFINHLKALK